MVRANSEYAIKKFTKQCQDLMSGRTIKRSFKYVYITNDNAEKLLAFIDCTLERPDRIALSYAFENMFESFLTYTLDEVVGEIVKINDEFNMTCEDIIQRSESKPKRMLRNTFALLFLAGGDFEDGMQVRARYTNKKRDGNGIYNINSPYERNIQQLRISAKLPDPCLGRSFTKFKILNYLNPKVSRNVCKLVCDWETSGSPHRKGFLWKMLTAPNAEDTLDVMEEMCEILYNHTGRRTHKRINWMDSEEDEVCKVHPIRDYYYK